jgi:hypothetical protein
LGITDHSLYLWAWSYDTNDINSRDPSNGSWTSSNEVNKFTYTAGADIYRFTLHPMLFYSRNGIGRIGYLIAKDGSGDKKSQDNYAEVSFQVTLTALSENSSTIITGGSLNVAANNTNGNAIT